MQHLDLDRYGLRIINFADVFVRAYKDIVKDLYVYDKFHDHNVRSQDTKRIYYYHLVKQLCDTIIQSKTDNRVVLFYSESDIRCDFKQCVNKRTRRMSKKNTTPEFRLFMSRFFKTIKSIIPIKTHISNVKFGTFVQYYNTNKGKYIDTINMLRSPVNRTSSTLEKFNNFVSKYKLTYLDKHYVNTVKLKCVMYK